MKFLSASPAICLCLMACVQKSETKWVSRSPWSSPYSATLVETTYNHGETNALRVRLDAAPQGDDGWFFVDDLNTGLLISPKPDMHWTSPNDLVITVHTAEIDGQTRRRFDGRRRPLGSLTIRYVADQPRQ